jgi:RND superfamily putative drug exporter
VTINGQSGGILPVLVFGAGTDYALLLVSRYREELAGTRTSTTRSRRAADRGPAILASGLTVIVALLTLSLAEVNGTAGLGPIGAMGVGLAMISMLTMLPALLAIFGRKAFWSPFLDTIPHVGQRARTRATAAGGASASGCWRARGPSGSRGRRCSSCSR